MRACLMLTTAIGAVALLGANCLGPLDPGPRDAALRTFASAEELRSYLATQAKIPFTHQGGDRTGGWATGLWGGVPTSGDMALSPPDAANGAEDSTTAGGGSGYSTTNIQEAGVDESDIIKNDGEYIYKLSGNRIHILRASPLEELKVIEVDAYGDSMYLRGHQLVAISSSGGWGYDSVTMPMSDGDEDTDSATTVSPPADVPGGPWYDGTQTDVAVIDVTDPANAVITRQFRFEGAITSSRLIGSKLHLVLATLPRLPDNPSPETIDAMTVDDWLPDVQVVSPDGTVTSQNIVGWANCLCPVDPDGYALTLVSTLDLDNLDGAIATTAVAANVGTVYASTAALYLTDTQYSYEDSTTHTDTMLHKLVFTDSGTQYVGSGLVPGRPLNQYSLGEHNEYLRIATTNETYRRQGQQLDNSVYVLGVQDNALAIIGSITGIAPDERIYAARFIGDRGFLVTYRQVDPLFTFDLKDPANPLQTGDLHVPGYAEHIQLLDENHLLTIGRETEETDDFALMQGVLLTIFDVTDMSNPKVLNTNGQDARIVIGDRGTYSEASSNPKAFNYYADRNVLALPIDLFEGTDDTSYWGAHTFTGLYVYRVTVGSGFEFLGRIASTAGRTSEDCYAYYYGPTRGVFIDDTVYSVTDDTVKAASLSDVGTLIGQASLTGEDSVFQYCWSDGYGWSMPD